MAHPKYPQKTLLTSITDHEVLPPTAIVLGRISDRLNYSDLLVFLKVDQLLVILSASGPKINGFKRYTISQFEAPLGLLSWFPGALATFRKPPVDGGLPAGAIAGAEQDVEGEMLSIQRAADAGNQQSGYDIVNWSRPHRRYAEYGSYSPSEIAFADNFLFEGGLLALITELGEKYRKGLL